MQYACNAIYLQFQRFRFLLQLYSFILFFRNYLQINQGFAVQRVVVI